MKQVISLFLLTMLCTVSSAQDNEKENSLILELTSSMRSLHVGQSTTIELKIVGQAITEIIRDINNIKPTVFNKKPEFVYKFNYQPQKEGDSVLGPYSLSFNGIQLKSNPLTIKVLPDWDGSFGTFFRVDCNEINLGESFELVMEIWSKERPKYNISALYNPEHATIEHGISRYKTKLENFKESHCFLETWIITPKSKGEFLITKELFRDFPDDIEPPQLKVLVK